MCQPSMRKKLKLLLLIGLFLAHSISFAENQSNQVGFWWKPTNPTWGLSIQQQGTHTLAIWFTYNTEHKPVWYSLGCDFVTQANETACVGDIYTGTGVPFDKITSAANVQFIHVGTGSLKLKDHKLSLSFSVIGGAQQQISDLEQLNLTTGKDISTCTLQATSRQAATNFTDLWWGGAAASGWGIHITQQSKQLFLNWGSYDTQGNASWIFGLGTKNADNKQQFSGTLYQFQQGAAFSTTILSDPPLDNMGTFTLNFSNGEQGSFTYTLPKQSITNRSLPLERLSTPNNGDLNVCTVLTSLSAPQQAARFLTQATFGAKMPEIEALAASGANGIEEWLKNQFNKPQSLHLPTVHAYYLSQPVEQQKTSNQALNWSLWKNFATADDQLRQRVTFALSELVVISLDSQVNNFPLGAAQYVDTLGSHAFGNFRNLLEAVTYSPMMGVYLSTLKNQKEDLVTGRVPDENYAREIMQLFSIGLYQLNLDGSLVLNANGKPIETYTNADITGLAKVFTGLSWAGSDTSSQRFFSNRVKDLENQIKPMQAYNQYHSISEKVFLKVTIPAQKNADTNGDIRIALDTLFNHPNVAPFIGKQLIQRLVTSNPSPSYIARVAMAFNNNGQGVRGDMQAVIKAILMDDEARNPALASPQSGKLREPIVRFVQWLRSFNATSSSGQFLIGATSRPDTQLAQSPLLSPSVFNFFRPNYTPPNGLVGSAKLLAPEAQITTETSVAGYLNFMRNAITSGVGSNKEVQANYSSELALADDPDKLLERISLLLGVKLNAATYTLIRDAVATISLANNVDANKLNRVKLALYLIMASPEYIVQN